MTIATPNVTLIAHTTINREAIGALMDIQGGSTDAETLVTFAGRSCYESFHRPNKATYHDPDYIERTIFEQQHGSIMEHASATLYFTGVSRAFLTELTRHRHLSFSVVSQRFVNESDASVVIPPAVRNLEKKHAKGASMFDLVTNVDLAEDAISDAVEAAKDAYGILVSVLEDSGLTRKQAREAARGVLPNMVETKMVVTGNLRAWHQVIERRTAPDADAEMIEVMTMANNILHKVAPTIFKEKK
ncbi:FAD-dependent thymidylate synthase [Corynebacterium glutamicum]|uniref:FAD-dependent thymidylate synthase n=1 Tax=Corynebacterium glutamicum TaxID=1718 RepID=UPI000305AC93|nr:FAD-dependent thymidylate synthase [Corynebacterium glutamicum]